MLLFLRRPKRTRLQWMRDMPALSGQSKASGETAKQSKKENKKIAKESQSNGNPASEVRNTNSVRRKDAQLAKQASSSSSQHRAHSSLERQNTIDSPPPPPPGKQPLQQLNVTTLPMGSNLMQAAPFPPPMHNHFHTLATHTHHFHHHHPPSLLAMQAPAHFHHPTCTLTPQPEQLHHLNAGQPAIPPLHYGSDAHLMRSLDSNLSSNLINPNFDPLNHLLNAGDLNAAEHLSAHSCLPSGLLNDVDHQNENLNHLNLHHNLDNHHLQFGLRRNESNELAGDRCSTLPLPPSMQSASCTNELTNLNGSVAAAAAANQATKQINPRQASCESSSSGGAFYLSQAAFKATEAIEFIAEHLRNEDEYIQVGRALIMMIIG